MTRILDFYKVFDKKKCNFGKTVLILTPHTPPLSFEQHEIEKSEEIDLNVDLLICFFSLC